VLTWVFGCTPTSHGTAGNQSSGESGPTSPLNPPAEPTQPAAPPADTSVPQTRRATTSLNANAVPDGAADGVRPSVRFVGRVDMSDSLGPRMAWPGTKVIARFDGTGASVTLSQMDGFARGPTFFNLVVDGVVADTPLEIAASHRTSVLAHDLAPGAHTIELEKRTEANLGTVRFEGFTFTGGAGLLAPPPAHTRLIEFLGDSAIDGYGILGNRAACPATDPPETNDSRHSFAFATAEALDAEMMLTAYSGKGILVNELPSDTDVFPKLWPRTLPEDAASSWSFSVLPDAVVVALGGVDMEGHAAAPPGFAAAYDAFVGTLRSHYPNAYLWLTVWSQVKDAPVATRTALTNVLTNIVSTRSAAGDARVFVYVFPEARFDIDETGCEAHANAAHEKAMAMLMADEVRARMGR
jgi:hypothetical protein